MEGLRNVVREFLLENFLFGEAPESLSDNDDLQERGVLDSLGMLKFVAFLEDRFGVEFLPEDLGAGLTTVDDVVCLVGNKLQA